MMHIEGSDEEHVACAAVTTHDAKQAGELTTEPKYVTCPGCVAELIADGTLLERGVEA